MSFFQIQGKDADPLIKFYQTTFGWEGNPAPDGGLMVAPEEGGIPGAVGPSSDDAAHLSVYITVTDVTQHLARAEEAGAQIAMRETQLPGGLGSIGGILDPAGNWVGLWSPPAGAMPTPPKKKAAKKPPQRAKKKASKKAPARKKAKKKKAAKASRPAPKKGGKKARKKSQRKARKKGRRR